MELSVGFTDKDKEAMEFEGYSCDENEWGNVYYVTDKVTITKEASVNYVVHPWVTCTEVEGIQLK